MDRETVITPETTTYPGLRGAHLSRRRDTGAMTTQLGVRLAGEDSASSTDVLGRVTTYAYSEDGLTTTQTTPPSGHVRHAQRAGQERSWKNPARDSGISSIPSTWLPTAFGPSRKPSPENGNRTAAQRSPTVPKILRTGRPNTIEVILHEEHL